MKHLIFFFLLLVGVTAEAQWNAPAPPQFSQDYINYRYWAATQQAYWGTEGRWSKEVLSNQPYGQWTRNPFTGSWVSTLPGGLPLEGRLSMYPQEIERRQSLSGPFGLDVTKQTVMFHRFDVDPSIFQQQQPPSAAYQPRYYYQPPQVLSQPTQVYRKPDYYLINGVFYPAQ